MNIRTYEREHSEDRIHVIISITDDKSILVLPTGVIHNCQHLLISTEY